MPPAMTAVRLDHITKRFGTTVALDAIDLQINAGELFFLLGPSGCGKSTLLRLIAGLHDPDEGRIFFNDRDVTPLNTDKRNAVMCFQSYALWPHMSVRENVRFGLQVRKVTKAEQDRRIDEVLSLVQMESLGDRKPNQLSGGQQQRVALARALANTPDIVLGDEPTGNLDSAASREVLGLLRGARDRGQTVLLVTHDARVAAAADRVITLRDGLVSDETRLQAARPVALPFERFERT